MNIRTRIIACICVISVLLSLIILSEAVANIRHQPEYTADNYAVATNNGIYYTETWNNEGLIYLIDSDGTVRYMKSAKDLAMEDVNGVCVADGYVYTLLYDSAYNSDGMPLAIYRLFQMTPELRAVGASDYFSIDADEGVSDIDYAGGHVYITTIENGGEAIFVYDVNTDDIGSYSAGFTALSETGIHPENVPKAESILFKNNSAGSFFVDANYSDGSLSVLTDRDGAVDGFKPDLRIKHAVDNIHFNLLQQIELYHDYVATWLIALIVWLALLFGIYIALQNRSRIVYVFVVTELMYLIILFSAFYFVRNRYESIAKTENARYASLVVGYELYNIGNLEDIDFDAKNYLRSEEYGELINELRGFMDSGNNSAYFYDLFVMRISDGTIMTSTLGYNFLNASYVHGSGLNDLQASLAAHNADATADVVIEGVNMEAAGVTGDNPTARYALVGVYYSGKYYTGLWSNTRLLIIIFLLTFILGSAIVAVIMIMQNMDLKEFETAMRDVALGRRKRSNPDTPALDIREMWNSLGELEKRMDEINYDKYRIFEGYYRFAPKNIETIMGKESIFDVKNGDITRAEGTLMLVSTGNAEYGEKRLNSLKNVISYMSRYEGEEDGILVSEDSSLSILQFLFLKENRMVTEQATQFLHSNSLDTDSGFVSTFLYYDEFTYGVVGVNSQSLAFLSSPLSKTMEEYGTWFGSLKLPLVITEDIAKREDAGQTRFIGYIDLQTEEDSRLGIYEVLDACDARQRQLKLVSREKFEETLGLFHSRDFYLARNSFSEILKECPEDYVARWYLFECEKFLNGEGDLTKAGSLYVSDRGQG